MSDEEELNAQRTRMMEISHEYGQTFNAFVSDEQPYPGTTSWKGLLSGLAA